VAGAIPPLAESYRPDKVGPFDQNVQDYKEIVKHIAPFADVLLCETMSTAEEARAAVTGASSVDLPIWVAWTLDEKKPVLRSGESIQQAFEAISSVKGANLQGCLFNCTSPEVITEAIPLLRQVAPSLQIGAYANGFLTASSGQGEYRDLSPEQYSSFAANWIASGATLIGGCCGVFPPHIAHLSASVSKHNATIEAQFSAASGIEAQISSL
jgi:S-methylmethionine-dependent homocysteine/selenocysteine methylase